jgi:hypothetical protein
MGSMRRKFSAMLLPMAVLVTGACSGSDGAGNGAEPDTVSATEYATGVCGAVAGWVDDIQGLNEDLQTSLDPSDLDALKGVMVDFLDGVVTATDSAISEVGAVGVPDVDDGEAAAETVLTALRDSRAIFEGARDRVDGLSTADPAAFSEELQALGTDLQTSMSGIGGELDQFASPELDEAAEDVPECDEVSAAA